MNRKFIITHDGKFHLDEILACVLLKKLEPHAEIIRTRDNNKISEIVSKDQHIAVVDVFAQFDHSKRLYDHHQRSFNATFSSEFKTKLSSSGLIYKYYGKKVLETYFANIVPETLEIMHKKIYKEYFEYEDAIDNGIDTGAIFRIRSLPNIIHEFNSENFKENNEDFMKALEFVTDDFERYMSKKVQQADKIHLVTKLIENTDSCEHILYLFELKECVGIVREMESRYDRDFYFVINKSDDEKFSAYAVPKYELGFETKLPFLEKWRGLRDEELQKSCGFDDAIFVHSSGFLAVAKSLDTLLKMCKITLQQIGLPKKEYE